MKKTAAFLNKHAHLVITLLVLLVYLCPYIINASQSHFMVHDNLNSNVVWYKIISESGKIGAANTEIIPNILGGLPRGCFPTEFNFYTWLYFLLGPLGAYCFSQVFIHAVAFAGAYIFTRRHFTIIPPALNAGIALAFATIPFWPSGGLSVAGVPFLMYALLNLYKGQARLTDWIIVFLFGFFSFLFLSGIAVLGAIAFWLLFLLVTRRRIYWKLVLACLVLVVAFACNEYRLFAMEAAGHFKNHRSGLLNGTILNLQGNITMAAKTLVNGQYHFYGFVSWAMALMAVGMLVYARSIFKYKPFRMFFYVSICFMLVAMMLPYTSLYAKLAGRIPFLQGINLRFYALVPVFHLLMLVAFVHAVIINTPQTALRKNIMLTGIGLMTVFNLFNIGRGDKNNPYTENAFYATWFDKANPENRSFANYYAGEIFGKAMRAVPQVGEAKIACLGFEPEIAQYHGLHTIDAYYYYYSTDIKERFYKIIAGELARTGSNYEKFMQARRCFLVSKDIENVRKGGTIDSLALDFELMKDMDCRYLLSAYPINTTRISALQPVFDAGRPAGARELRHLYIYAIQ